MGESFTIYYKTYEQKDPRLGRNVKHDSRSLHYQVEPESLDSLKSIRHNRLIPVLDQGNLGSCTGNAAIGCLGTGYFYDPETVHRFLSPSDATVDERIAVQVYSDATRLDSYNGTYPPTDTGSDGLSVVKVLQQKGLISGYQHAMSLAAALTALSKQPVIVGTSWHENMFNPAANGRLSITGSVQGGHEYVLDELDVENKRVWLTNSWSRNWGVQGRAYLSWDDLGTLLADDGDCTVFTPLSQPAPAPTPPPTPPVPVPTDAHAQFLKDVDSALSKYLSSK